MVQGRRRPSAAANDLHGRWPHLGSIKGVHRNLAVLYREKIAGLRDALYEPDARDAAFELIRSLIERVVLTPVGGELRIDLHGELAGILSICDGSKKPASSPKRRAEQIKMVAGA